MFLSHRDRHRIERIGWLRATISSLPIATMLLNFNPRESVKKFFAGLRTSYQTKKKNRIPMEKKQRQLSIGYFVLAFFMILMIQNYFASSHVEIIPYSQFKSLLNKGLLGDIAIGETTIEGNMKGEAVKEIFTPEKLKTVAPEIVEGKKLLPFVTVRVEDPALTAELEAAKVPFKGEVTNTWLPTILFPGWFQWRYFFAVELYWQEDGVRQAAA